MNEIEIIINGLKHSGASKEEVLKVMEGLINGKVNLDDENGMDIFLRKNLDLDTYISLTNLKLINGKIL
jgi:hypothetical protein